MRRVLSIELNIGVKSTSEHIPMKHFPQNYCTKSLRHGNAYELEKIMERENDFEVQSNSEAHGSHSHISEEEHMPDRKGVPLEGLELADNSHELKDQFKPPRLKKGATGQYT